MLNNPPDRNLGFLIYEVLRLLRRNLDRRMRLTQAQWRALAFLSRNEGINQAGLADLLEVRPITMARLIDRLEQDGWVERRRDPSDRRAVRLYLTPKAGPLLEEIYGLADETRELALGGLSVPARNQLIDSLTTIKNNLLAAEQDGNSQAQAKRKSI